MLQKSDPKIAYQEKTKKAAQPSGLSAIKLTTGKPF